MPFPAALVIGRRHFVVLDLVTKLEMSTCALLYFQFILPLTCCIHDVNDNTIIDQVSCQRMESSYHTEVSETNSTRDWSVVIDREVYH